MKEETFTEAVERIISEPREKWIQDIYDMVWGNPKPKLVLVKDE